MTSPVRVARVDSSTLDDAVALRYRWRTEEAGESARGLDEYASSFRTWFEGHAATHRGFLAVEGDEAVGCAWLASVERVPSPANPSRRAGMLQIVYVVPERRDAGVGTFLVSALAEVARRDGLEYLMVHPSTASFAFYRRMGFSDASSMLEWRLGLAAGP